MFTGIIESLGRVRSMEKEGSNLHLTIQADIAQELKIDQSVAHNGVCLTVVSIEEDRYVVTVPAGIRLPTITFSFNPFR
jgi:riboflavin synthase